MSVFDQDDEGEAATVQESRENGVSFNDVQPGFFDKVGYGVGMGVARGAAKVGRAGALAVAGGLVLAEKAGGYEPGSVTDSYFESVVKPTDEAVEFFTPNANEVGTVGRVLGGLAEIVAPLAATGGNPALFVASAGLNAPAELVKQGVDSPTAVGLGVLEASVAGLGFRLPFLGPTLLTKTASGAAGTLGLFTASTAVNRAVLQERGYEELAEQYDPFDLEARTVDLLMGIAFGGLAHLHAGGKPVQPTRTERDAALAALNAKHFQNDTAPGRPADEAALAAHQRALEESLRQLQEGEPVDVRESGVTEAEFVARPREPLAPPDAEVRSVLDELGIRDPAPRDPGSDELRFERNAEEARRVTETPEFKQWFGESKVMDAEGQPLRVYHGTGKDFTSFDLSKIQRPGFGYGFHFAEEASLANFYSEQWSDGTRGTGDVLVPAYLSIKRPFTGDYYSYLAEHGNDHKAARDALIAEGYDGIRYSHNRQGDAWVAFDPSQIKSATGNRGTFDPTSDDIRFERNEPADEPALPFYSALTRAAENAKLTKGGAEQWMGNLRNIAGVKPEELQNTDLESWLKSLRRPATKEEVVEYLRANQLVIEEMESGSIAPADLQRVLDDIDGAEGTFADFAEGDSDYQTALEPTPEHERFDTTQRVTDKHGEESEIELEVKIKRFDRGDEGWKEGGTLSAVVTFPDDRQAWTGAHITSGRGGLELTPYETPEWSYRGNDARDFTDSEIEAIEAAIKEITLEENSELDMELQEASRDFDHALQQARRYLNNGRIAKAIEELEDAGSIERKYGDDPVSRPLIEALQEGKTVHDTWQEDGPKEDYTELKLMLPVPSPPRATAREIAKTAFDRAYSNLVAARNRGAPAEELAALEAARVAADEAVLPIRKYTSPETHWPSDEKNIVAFVRFNTRIDADGKRVLFLEEVQTDWHAAAREKLEDENNRPRGYEDPGAKAAYDAALMARATAEEKHLQLWDEYEQSGGTGRSHDLLDSYNVAKAALDEADARVAEAKEAMRRSDKGVPDAPFKTSWQELAFKRMIRYAADNGFERIAWTTGEMQIQRYNLGKVVDQIEVVREADGQFTYRATKDDQAQPLKVDTVKNLEALAGALGSKDMARKAADLEPGGSVKIRGEGLKIGGAKQRLLYDVALPGAVNKLVKKWGGKVGSTEIDVGASEHEVRRADGSVFGRYSEIADARDGLTRAGAGATLVPIGSTGSSVQMVDMTPAMIEAARAGFPMFQRGARDASKIKSPELRREVENTLAQFKEQPAVSVVESYDQLPAELQSAIAKRGAKAGEVRAVFWDGGLHLVADQYGSAAEVRKGVIHETVAHFGLRTVVDEPTRLKILDGIARDQPAEVAERGAREFGEKFDASDQRMRRVAAEEVMAYHAGNYLEGKAVPGAIRQYIEQLIESIKAFVRRAMGKEGVELPERFGREEMEAVIDGLAKHLRRGSKARSGESLGDSLAGTKQRAGAAARGPADESASPMFENNRGAGGEPPPARPSESADGQLEDPDVAAARQLIEQSDLEIPTGEIDAEGNPIVTSARELMAAADAEVANATSDAKGYEVAISCLLSFGGS